MSSKSIKQSDKPERDERPQPAEKPVSLHPLKFKEAVRDLFKIRTGNCDD